MLNRDLDFVITHSARIKVFPIKTIPTPEDSSVVPHVRAVVSGELHAQARLSLALVVRVGRMTFDFLVNLFAGNRYSAYTQTISHLLGLSSDLRLF